MWESKIVVD